MVTAIAAACAPAYIAGQGSLDGIPWKVTVYPNGNDVCFNQSTGISTCDALHPDQRTGLSTSSVDGSGIKIADGVVRPDIVYLRLRVDGVEQVLSTIALPFRSDVRAYAAAFPESADVGLMTTLDAQGNVLEEVATP